MKRRNSLRISVLSLATLVTLSGCSIAKNGNSSEQKSTKDITLPLDRKALQVQADPKAYSPEEFAKGVIKGDWAIEKVNGKTAVGETTPFLKFAPSEGRVYGNNGCNTINADYEYDAKDFSLKFSNPAVTMRLCHVEGITDTEINIALNDTRRYSLQETTDGYLLNLYNSKGQQVMQLSHQNLDFLNGTWKVVSIDGEKINVEKMKLVFDIDERKVHGNTGCNVLNGRLETDMDSPNTFSFEGMGVTMMMCPEIEYQTAMLVALEEACKAKPVNKNEVMLLDSEGNNVMTLKRTSDK